ncbi:MAG: RNA methyltransferase, partial [Bacteroidales bacterium]|nr:RNA methyltransferase [Bacteroidales bacterium]
PTKNLDRYEWFAEKATELGLDVISPVIGDHSERKVFKSDRLRRLLVSASKQSLKGAVPTVQEPRTVREFIASAPKDALKLICCCFEGETPRTSINDALEMAGQAGHDATSVIPDGIGDLPRIIILIGPEGDFSREEAALAVAGGFVPVHLGPSRLRTETAALTAVEAVYLKNI